MAPTQCINALKKLDRLIREPKKFTLLPTLVLDCLKEIDASLKQSFGVGLSKGEKAAAIRFMTEQGALHNIVQVFCFVQKRAVIPRNEILWNEIEVQILILCFDLFSYADHEY